MNEHAHHEAETKVTTLELFFDLVFVFAVTQVTSMLAADPTAIGALRGLFVLAAVWWAWVAYAWLTNGVNPDRGAVRLSLVAAMGAMWFVSLSVPEAFGRSALSFAIALFLVRLMHLVLYAIAAKTRELRAAVFRLAPGVVIGSSLIVVAAFTHGALQLGLWAVALAFDYGAPLVSGTRGWQVSPAHFAERHGLIVIIALGEAIIALGIGAQGLEPDVALVAAASAGIVAAFGLWWSYFDRSIVFAENRLRRLQGEERNRMARDSYSYLHLPIIAGIVLFALGAKKTLAHVSDPLHGLGAVALGLGPALVLATLSLLRWRHVGAHNRLRLGAAALCLCMSGVAAKHSAVAAMLGIALILAGLIAAERVWSRRMQRLGAS